ncbi:hypothetical protein [Neptuniibacter sp. QD37_11]|uniref:hypothetical protein n=1 Tax=Neptuniibacter sp. QD37_11 TaxID=3398209 RepID=UPI0039F605F2
MTTNPESPNTMIRALLAHIAGFIPPFIIIVGILFNTSLGIKGLNELHNTEKLIETAEALSDSIKHNYAVGAFIPPNGDIGDINLYLKHEPSVMNLYSIDYLLGNRIYPIWRIEQVPIGSSGMNSGKLIFRLMPYIDPESDGSLFQIYCQDRYMDRNVHCNASPSLSSARIEDFYYEFQIEKHSESPSHG